MSKPKRYSQLQLSVLRFYRETLKFAYTKEEPTKSNLKQYLQKQFQTNAQIPRKNFQSIEHQMRMGKNRFKMIKEFNQIDGINLV